MAVAAEVFLSGGANQFTRAPESAGPPLEAEGPHFSDLRDFHQRYIRCNAVPCIFYAVFPQDPFKISGGGSK